MASILSPLSNKKVTPKFLRELGFTNISWGSPVKVTVIREKGRAKRKLDFAECQYCWEWFDDEEIIDDYWKVLIYYYPKGFDAFVTPFQGDWKNPMHPENYAMITVDNRDDNWCEKVYVETEDDIKAIFAIAKARVKYLNKEVFGTK